MKVYVLFLRDKIRFIQYSNQFIFKRLNNIYTVFKSITVLKPNCKVIGLYKQPMKDQILLAEEESEETGIFRQIKITVWYD